MTLASWSAGTPLAGAYKDSKLLDSRVVNTSVPRGTPIVEAKLAPPTNLFTIGVGAPPSTASPAAGSGAAGAAPRQ